MRPRQPGYQSNRSERQENRVLVALAAEPLTTFQLAEKLHLSRNRTTKHLRCLRKRPSRRVRVVAYELGAGRPRHVYGLGSGRDITISAFQQGRIIDMLIETPAPWSAYQISERLGMGYGNVKIYMRALKKAKKVHVARWLWSNKTPFALYLVGDGENVPRPTKRPGARAPMVTAPQGIFAALGL